MLDPLTILLILAAVFVVIALATGIRIVPQKEAFIIERLGKFADTWEAGLHVKIPLLDRVAYRHTLKEQAIDVPPQSCITRDNIAVEVDGILYMQIVDPSKASYGIDNYKFASTQLAQTTMRSVIGKLDLDKTFEERETINAAIVEAVDKASDPWGVKVTRYEVKNIVPPQSIKDAMEKQMRAEREKRAQIAESEGERQAKINVAEGDRAEAIALSEGEKQRRINEAEGHAYEIERVSSATSDGIRQVAAALNEVGGVKAANLRVAEQYVKEFGNLAKSGTSMIIPSNLADVAGMLKSAQAVLQDNMDDPSSSSPASDELT